MQSRIWLTGINLLEPLDSATECHLRGSPNQVTINKKHNKQINKPLHSVLGTFTSLCWMNSQVPLASCSCRSESRCGQKYSVGTLERLLLHRPRTEGRGGNLERHGVCTHCLYQKKRCRRENEGSQSRGLSWGSSGAPPSRLESDLEAAHTFRIENHHQ